VGSRLEIYWDSYTPMRAISQLTWRVSYPRGKLESLDYDLTHTR